MLIISNYHNLYIESCKESKSLVHLSRLFLVTLILSNNVNKFGILAGMARLTNEEVLELSKLAKISISGDDIDSYKADLEEILNFVEKLSELDTEGLEPTFQVTGLTNITRPDTVEDYGISQEAILANLPNRKGNHIKVPKVL